MWRIGRTYAKLESKNRNGGKISEHIYVGSGKRMERIDGTTWLKVQIDLTKIKNEAMAHTRNVMFRDGEHTLINLVLAPMNPENCDKYRDHSLKVDTWKPDPTRAKAADPEKSDSVAEGVDNLPF